jgi:hypothetical protein
MDLEWLKCFDIFRKKERRTVPWMQIIQFENHVKGFAWTAVDNVF